MSITNSPNMNLPIPGVGTEPSPDYAQDVNASLTLVDSHDHTPGKGALITPAAMDINVDLDMNSMFLLSTAGVQLVPQGSTPGVNTLYESGADLYWVDAVGNDVRITQNGAVAGTPGSIANLAPPASAAYVAGSSKFVWQSNTNIAADMDFGSAIMRNLSPNSTFAMTLAPPAGMASNSTITLPVVPAGTSFVTISNAGAMSTVNYPLPFGGLATNSVGTANIIDANVTLAKMANDSVSTNQLVASCVTLAKMAADSVGTTQLVAASVTNGKLAASNIVYSGTCVTFSTTSTSYVVPDNLSLNITSVGRSIRVWCIISPGAESVSGFGDSGSNYMAVRLIRVSGSAISYLETIAAAPFYAATCLTGIETPAAGTHNYLVQIKSLGGGTVSCSNIMLVAEEIGV